MSFTSDAVSDAELCAYLDGELPEPRLSEVAQVVRAHPHLQAKLKLWRAQQQWLRASFSSIAQEPVPEILTQALPEDKICPTPHAVVRLPLDSPSRVAMIERGQTYWKMLALTLGALLFATGVYATGVVPGTAACSPALFQKWLDQPKSLRGS